MSWILNGLIEAALTLIADTLSIITDSFLGAFDMQFSKFDQAGNAIGIFDQFFPTASAEMQPILLALGYGLFFVILMFQLAKGFLGPISDGEHPLMLVGRSAICFVSLVFCYRILTIIQIPLNSIYHAFAQTRVGGQLEVITRPIGPTDMGGFGNPNITQPNGMITSYESSFSWPIADGWQTFANDIGGGTALSTIGFTLIAFVFTFAIGWAYITLLLEIVERYIILGVMFYTAPLAFAMIVSAATRPIFQSWVKMLGSQYILMFLNVFFLKMFISAMYNAPSPIGGVTTFSQFFLWNLCLLAFLKLGQKIDRHMASLGLSTAQAGASLGATIAGTAFGITMASRSGGKAISGFKDSIAKVRSGSAVGSIGADILGAQGFEKTAEITGMSNINPNNIDTQNSYFKDGQGQMAYQDGTKVNVRSANNYSPYEGYACGQFQGADGNQYYMAGNGDLGTISDAFGGEDLKNHLESITGDGSSKSYEPVMQFNELTGSNINTGAYNMYDPSTGITVQYSPQSIYDVPQGEGVSIETFGQGHHAWNRVETSGSFEGVYGREKPMMDSSFSQFTEIKGTGNNQGAQFDAARKRRG